MMMIPDHDQDIINKAIYLPLLIINLNRDLLIVENSTFKLKTAYLNLIDKTLRSIQLELAQVKRYMYRNKIKVERQETDKMGTHYLIVYNGYQQPSLYANNVLKSTSDELLNEYMNKNDD
ncbi:hypothetical protein [Bacillus sp. FJAT-50079]|uniref:hypothetical protein n=1 Tax=Bacillus sp. FJAT-50079 TaxID=2833577 RepID=UPI001BCA1106|nr:hypothetical protein [Bacillus sp. FJAT-50079]MBS4207439.1 hypothetical protein [Bacillus sp. FJAT-50079]